MNKTLTALCDQCDKITDVVYKKAKHPKGIEETYFTCEHCEHRYTSFVTDAWVRKKQRALKAMPRKGNKNLVKMLDDKQLEINNRMTKLKNDLIKSSEAL